jgi:hypothetical protein
MTSMIRIWAMCIAILSTLLMTSAMALPAAFGATQTSGSAPVVHQNSVLAGYAAVSPTNGSVTSVYASFTIPKVTCNSSTSAGYQDALFVAGLDGYNSADFENVGVAAFCQVGPNSVEYYAVSTGSFTSIEGTVAVKAGDVISVSITVSGGNFHYSFKDVTTGKSATDSSPATGVPLDAADCGVIGAIPFSRFAPVSFGKASTGVPNTCDARINGAKHALGRFGSALTLYKLVLIDPATNDTLATPSALSDSGSSFTVTWKAAS